MILNARREPDHAANHWAKFNKLLKADEVFCGAAKYLRRFTHGVGPFAQFVSSTTASPLMLTFFQIQKHARSARANDSSTIRNAISFAFEDVQLDNCKISALTRKEFFKGSGVHIKFNSLCTTRLLINIED